MAEHVVQYSFASNANTAFAAIALFALVAGCVAAANRCLAVAIPCLLICLAFAAWLFYKRRSHAQVPAAENPPTQRQQRPESPERPVSHSLQQESLESLDRGSRPRMGLPARLASDSTNPLPAHNQPLTQPAHNQPAHNQPAHNQPFGVPQQARPPLPPRRAFAVPKPLSEMVAQEQESRRRIERPFTAQDRNNHERLIGRTFAMRVPFGMRRRVPAAQDAGSNAGAAH